MNDELSTRAREIVAKIIYVTIATADGTGQPWNTPVYAAYDENYNFYWGSWIENVHSRNIRENGRAFLVIYDSTVPEGTGEGVYIKATACELNEEQEVAQALTYWYGRANKPRRKASEFLGRYPRRIYKAVPKQVWLNTRAEVNGNHVDKRTEVSLA